MYTELKLNLEFIMINYAQNSYLLLILYPYFCLRHACPLEIKETTIFFLHPNNSLPTKMTLRILTYLHE